MIINYEFAIITPDHNDPDIIALKNFISGYGYNVCLLSYVNESLDYVIENKIANVIVFNENGSRFASKFITDASVRKIFHSTSFYFLSEQFLPMEEQIKMMTLGYMGFLRFPFSPFEVQNTIDLSLSALKKIA